MSGYPDVTSTATSSSPVGLYPITVGPGDLSATNYYVPYYNLLSGTLTVVPSTINQTSNIPFIDPLTEANWEPTPTAALAGKSLASNNNGDFVVVWSSDDSGGLVTDVNVYARYYTLAQQRVSLPENLDSFSLQYDGTTYTVSIPVSSDPAETAANIQQAFSSILSSINTAPVFFPPDGSITNQAAHGSGLDLLWPSGRDSRDDARSAFRLVAPPSSTLPSPATADISNTRR